MWSDRRTLGAAASIVAMVVVGAVAARAGRSVIRVRWEPSPSDDIAGYRVYTRPLDAPYGNPRDVGLPPVQSDGTVSSLLPDIERTGDYAFAVTAYTADGTESDLSNELVLYAPGVRAACTELHCATRDDCFIAASPDGIACYQADPCNTGACAGGTCAVTAPAAPGDNVLVRFIVRKVRGRGRLVAGAALQGPLSLEDAVAGTTIELRDATGKALYAATLPGGAFRRTRDGQALVYRRPSTGKVPAATNGLTRVVLRRAGNGADLSLHAVAGALARVPTDTQLIWVVRLGNRCASNPAVVCRSGGKRATYCG
ncbi:MAG TPA: fibronectin type III domain-containing protein [Candidatus Nitrosopolaris sp.]|nr:fibronectin type III domain-containing protein [Candidatus Nitrosopolaris sp.]